MVSEGKASLATPHGCCELHKARGVVAKRYAVKYRCNSSGLIGKTVCQSLTFHGALNMAEHLMGDITILKIEEA
jgi:hypothetical protein